MAKEIYLTKRVQDAICEFADAKKCTYAEAEREFVAALMAIGRMYRQDPQKVVDRIETWPPEKMQRFFDGVRNV